MLLILFASILLNQPLAAAQEPGSEPDLIITPIANPVSGNSTLSPQDPALESQELEIRYNPKDFSDTPSTESKEQILGRLREAMALKTSLELNEIPELPKSAEQLDPLEELNEKDLHSFLTKKKKFLEKIQSVLQTLHLRPKLIRRVLIEVNQKFYESSTLIAKSNATGATILFSLQGSLALPKKLVEALQERPLAKFIPRSGGFGYLFGFGAGLTRQVQENGKTHWVFEVFADIETLKSSMTGNFSLGVASTYGVVYELREGAFRKQHFDTTYGSVTGAFRQGPSEFGWGISTGLGFPPMVGAAQVFTNTTHRYYLVRVDFTDLHEKLSSQIGRWVSLWKNPSPSTNAGLSCSQVFQ